MNTLYLPLTLIAVPVVCIVTGRPLLPHLALAWGGLAFALSIGACRIPWGRLRSSTREEWSALVENSSPPPWALVLMKALMWGTTLGALWGLP